MIAPRNANQVQAQERFAALFEFGRKLEQIGSGEKSENSRACFWRLDQLIFGCVISEVTSFARIKKECSTLCSGLMNRIVLISTFAQEAENEEIWSPA